MSIFRSGGSQPASTPDYTGLQIQTAVSALPIPIVWGTSKLAPNVIWYANFKAIAAGSSGGGGKWGFETTSRELSPVLFFRGFGYLIDQFGDAPADRSIGDVRIGGQ